MTADPAWRPCLTCGVPWAACYDLDGSCCHGCDHRAEPEQRAREFLASYGVRSHAEDGMDPHEQLLLMTRWFTTPTLGAPAREQAAEQFNQHKDCVPVSVVTQARTVDWVNLTRELHDRYRCPPHAVGSGDCYAAAKILAPHEPTPT